MSNITNIVKYENIYLRPVKNPPSIISLSLSPDGFVSG